MGLFAFNLARRRAQEQQEAEQPLAQEPQAEQEAEQTIVAPEKPKKEKTK
jgi:hypothetical protein